MDSVMLDLNAIQNEGDRTLFAQGEPNNNLLTLDEKKPYMCSFDSLPENSIVKYVPLWEKLNPGKHENQFHIFLNNKSSWVRNKEIKDGSKSPTHVTMDRMKFFIESNEEDDFWKYYTGAILQGKILYFTEQLTEIFRYFCDFDIVQKGGIIERNIEALTFVVQKSINKFYKCKPNELFVVVSVSMYSIKKAHDDVPEMRKTGVHMHWPNLFVNKEIALNIRETIILDLENTFGKRVFPNNSWHDVVDASVYMKAGGPGGGLRMMGSHKTENCKECKGHVAKKNEKKCDHCGGNGKVGIGRPYHAIMVLNGDGKRRIDIEEMYRNNMLQLMMDTKLRTTFTEPQPKFVLPEGFPTYLQLNNVKQKVHKSHENATRTVLMNNNPEWDLLLKYIRSYNIYKNTFIKSVTSNKNQTEFVIHLNGENSRYCHNIGREHNSNRIYIVVNKEGIFQRCHDSADEQSKEMKFGLCKEYKYNLNIKFGNKDISTLFKKTNISNDDEESLLNVHMIDDKKIQRCYLLGDDECMIVYNCKWSHTVQTDTGEDIYIQDKNFYSMDASALGIKHSRALVSIGFEPEQQKLLHRREYPSKNLKTLQEAIIQKMYDIVQMACEMDVHLVVEKLTKSGFDGVATLQMNLQPRHMIEDILILEV